MVSLTGILYYVGNKAKGQISNRVFREKKARQIFRKKEYFLRNVRFSENLKCFIFFQTPTLRFALLRYYRRLHIVPTTNHNNNWLFKYALTTSWSEKFGKSPEKRSSEISFW